MVKKVTKDEVVTVRLGSTLRQRLDDLAFSTDRSKSFLAAEAIEQYVELQEWQIEGIKEGLRQADAGEFAKPAEMRALFAKYKSSR